MFFFRRSLIKKFERNIRTGKMTLKDYSKVFVVLTISGLMSLSLLAWSMNSQH
jgi:hypothetical protein